MTAAETRRGAPAPARGRRARSTRPPAPATRSRGCSTTASRIPGVYNLLCNELALLDARAGARRRTPTSSPSASSCCSPPGLAPQLAGVRGVRRARAPRGLLAAPRAAWCAPPARRARSRSARRRTRSWSAPSAGRWPRRRRPSARAAPGRARDRRDASSTTRSAAARRAGAPGRIARRVADAQWVYDFSEGSREMRDLLGGKGANVAEMTRILGADRVPGRLHDHDRGVRGLHARGRASRTASTSRSTRRWRGSRSAPARSSATPRTRCWSRCARGARESMPGMLDTVLNLGLNDDVGAGAGRRRPATSASRGTPTGASCRCSATSCAAIEGERFEDEIKRVKADRGVKRRHRARRRGAAGAHAQLQGALRVPHRSARAARAGDPGRLRLVDTASAPSTYRRINRIPDDWGTAVNVQQMVFGNKGDTSARASPSAATRSPARRSPAATSSSTPRARTSSRACATRCDISELDRVLPEVHDAADGDPARRSSATTATCRTPSSRSRRAAVHAADAQRQAPGAGGGALRGRRGRRGPARQGRRRCRRSTPRRSTRCCTRPSTRRPSTTCSPRGVAASPGAAIGRDRLHRRRRGRGGRRRARRDPRAPVHRGRRRRRLPRGEGDPHLRGRQGLARGARGARHGRAGGDRRQRPARSTSSAGEVRVDGDRRCTPATGWPSTARPASITTDDVPLVEPEVGERVRHRAAAGPTSCARLRRAHERRHARGRAQGARVRRRGHRAVPHRAHVLRRGPPREDGPASSSPTTSRSAASASTSSLPLQQGDFEGLFEAMEGLPVTIRLLDPPLHEFLPRSLTTTCPSRRPAAERLAPRVAAGGQPDARHARRAPRAPAIPRSTRCRSGR